MYVRLSHDFRMGLPGLSAKQHFLWILRHPFEGAVHDLTRGTDSLPPAEQNMGTDGRWTSGCKSSCISCECAH